MGTWGSGNFAGDAALDFVESIAAEVDKELVPPEDFGDIEIIMAAVATRIVLIDHCNASRPDRGEVETLRDRVLEVYDEEIEGLDPDPEYLIERRRVIEQTFDALLKLIEAEG
jgi:hypothetical protein